MHRTEINGRGSGHLTVSCADHRSYGDRHVRVFTEDDRMRQSLAVLPGPTKAVETHVQSVQECTGPQPQADT